LLDIISELFIIKIKEVLIMWKKVVCLFLILSFITIMVGCGGVPTVPPVINSELVIVRITDPESNLISVAGKENEDVMAILGDKDTEGNPTSITGAIYVLEQGDTFGIDAGEDGLPTYLIDSKGNKIIFGNYTNSTVDISIYDSNGDVIQEPIIINVDPADLLELKQLYSSFYSQQKSRGKNIADDVATGLKWGAKALPWVACTTVAPSLPALMLIPAIAEYVVYCCASSIITTIISEASSLTEDQKVELTAAQCGGGGGTYPLPNLAACGSTALNVLADWIKEDFGNHAPVISSLTANPSSINISETTTITCTASDEDVEDTLTYTWTTTDGTFEGSTSGPSTIWKAPNTQGNYTITCMVNDGEVNSEPINVIINVIASSPIEQVQLSSPSNGATVSTSTVILSWGSVSGATGYEVVYDTSSSFTNPSGWSVPGMSQTTGTLTNGTTYYWRVRAFAGSQYYSWSSVWSFTKSGAIVPPTGLSVSSSWNTTSPGFPSMTLSWNAVSGATGYEMWVRPSGGSYASLGIRDAPYVTFNSNSLPGGARYVSGTTYYFKLRTITASGTSAFTSEVMCVAAAAPSTSLGQVQLSSPSNGVTLLPGNITFSWNFVSNTTKYQFILYNQQGGIALDTTYSGTSTTVTLGAEETITWKVRAGDNSGNWGTWSDTWSLTLKSTTINPVPPTGFSVSSYWNTASPGFPSMTLSWNAVSGATGYDMWVRSSSGSSTSLGTRDAPYVTFNSYSLPGGARYVSGTTYYFKICTVTASGTSGFTSEVMCVAAAAPSPYFKVLVDRGCGSTYKIGDTISIVGESNVTASGTLYSYWSDGSIKTYQVSFTANQTVILYSTPLAGVTGLRRYKVVVSYNGVTYESTECSINVTL
jgi:hypothetical protein